MSASARNPLERRLLVLAPVGKDALLIAAMLARNQVDCLVCRDFRELIDEVRHGAAAIVMAEEALLMPHDTPLGQVLSRQPAWSDLQVLLLTRAGANSEVVEAALRQLGNVTLLERPIRISALTSTVRTALRARERQYEIRAYVEERDRADRAKDEFLAMLAHELRNPLAPIRNSLDFLRLNNMESARPELFEIVERQVGHLSRLVDDLMDVSRVTRGKIDLQKQDCSIADVVGTAVEMSRPHIETAHDRLELVLPEEPIVVDADPVRLAQVFSNLLNNAVKYSEPGAQIRVSARADAECAIVTVADSGIGIAPDELPHLFDMFYQAGAAGRRTLSGLGIGLTLSRSVVELHGGTIVAQSEGLGRGSRFVVSLPLAPQQVAKALQDSVPAALPDTPRVLVVDDNRDAADTLARLLQQLGAEVRVAHDGACALQMFDEFNPAATFLDIGMPGMDGYEVATRLRARGHGHEPLLVALTGWGQEQDRRRTLAAGFRHHMIKPASVKHLREVLASIG